MGNKMDNTMETFVAENADLFKRLIGNIKGFMSRSEDVNPYSRNAFAQVEAKADKRGYFIFRRQLMNACICAGVLASNYKAHSGKTVLSRKYYFCPKQDEKYSPENVNVEEGMLMLINFTIFFPLDSISESLKTVLEKYRRVGDKIANS